MSDIKIESSQLRRLERSMKKAGVSYEKGTKRLLKKIGVVVLGLSRTYAPESLTRSLVAAQNKSGKTNMNPTLITSGSLRDSITMEIGKAFVSIFVPSNSRAGKYAEKMHDEKGETWDKLSARSKQKGSKVGDKYIERAAKDSEKEINALIDKTISDILKGIGV